MPLQNGTAKYHTRPVLSPCADNVALLGRLSQLWRALCAGGRHRFCLQWTLIITQSVIIMLLVWQDCSSPPHSGRIEYKNYVNTIQDGADTAVASTGVKFNRWGQVDMTSLAKMLKDLPDSTYLISWYICNAVRCNVMQCNKMQCNSMQCNAMQCNAMQCNAMQCNAMQCNAMQCNAKIMRCNTMQCNAMQCKAMQRQCNATQRHATQSKYNMQCKSASLYRTDYINDILKLEAATIATIPVNTTHSSKVGSMLAHCLRRWKNINSTLGEYLVFAGIITPTKYDILVKAC